VAPRGLAGTLPVLGRENRQHPLRRILPDLSTAFAELQQPSASVFILCFIVSRTDLSFDLITDERGGSGCGKKGGGMDNATPHGKGFLALAFLAISASILSYSLSHAAVTGPCSNCHTMHNSQNGSPLVRVGTVVGWGGSGLTGGDLSQEPMSHLLVTGCVGCHTSTTSDTIVNYGGSSIPIVYNTVPPVDSLAGGNFY